MGFDRTSVIFEFSLKWVFFQWEYTSFSLYIQCIHVYICTCRNMDSRHPLQKQSSVNSSEQNSQDVRKQEANKSHQICSGNTFYRLWDTNVLYFVQKCAPRNFTDCLYGYIMVSSAIWKKRVFQRLSKLHESEGRVQFEVFEKLTSVCFFSNCTRNHTITYW
jgi:hypothetical protein